MPVALHRDVRKTLEGVVREARKVAEEGARTALRELGVADARAPSWLTEERKALRVRLRAHARTLGDPLDTGEPARMPRLIREIAYAHWHRALFARFLVENGLLVDVEHGGGRVSREDLTAVAEDEGKDVVEVAAEYAQPMLPEIFPADDPVLALQLPPEARQRLAGLVDGLPAQTFKADDALGWTYQFWQADRKEEVNRLEVKIGADELPAVTQLFTEDYMVLFLLENTLGAWWAGKRLSENPDLARDAADEDELRRKLSPEGYTWTYLRFVREGESENGVWRPAAGIFPGWPARAAEITLLDPCMGSGHFLVFALDILVTLRKAEEGLDEAAAVTAVLRDNLHGLEIDPRCTQIAAFTLALAAWKRMGGVRPLPKLHLACSGLPIGMGKAEFVRLAETIAEAEGFAGGRADLLGRERNPMEETALVRRRGGLERLHDLFAQAPILGSLIDPRWALADGTLFEEGFDGVACVLGKVLARTDGDPEVREAAVTAQGLATAADLLARRFTLVATNVPYLGKGKMHPDLLRHVKEYYPAGYADLSTVFIMRALRISSGSIVIVAPTNWWFQKSYAKLRQNLISGRNLQLITNLGAAAFDIMNWWAAQTSLQILSAAAFSDNLSGINASQGKWTRQKSENVINSPVQVASFKRMERIPECRFAIDVEVGTSLLSSYASSYQGIKTGDDDYFRAQFWELAALDEGWRMFQGNPMESRPFAGCNSILRWGRTGSEIARLQGVQAHNKAGLVVGQMRELPVSLFGGNAFDSNVAAVIPCDPMNLPAIFAFTASAEYRRAVRKIDTKVAVANSSITKVPFDLPHWQRIGAERYPNGLPRPYSNDPTQWLFDGCPRGSADPNNANAEGGPTRPGLAEHPLQVAVARLVGYRWPRQTGSSFMGCPAIAEPDEIDRAGVVDEDGIVCLPSLHGEAAAAERVRAVLRAAWGADWREGVVRACLGAEGWDKDLESWLADGFFDGHCKLFHQAPFVWHVWDGIRGGFSALVNYHKLCAPDGAGRRLLEKLRDTYLGEWISAQRRAVARGDATAEDRLAAGQHLHEELSKIIEGEPPYDIFVRWKPLHEQPIGWQPDIGDGVRLNIRPFLTARPWRARGQKACILRVTPGVKKHAGADRGGEPFREKEDYPWFWAEEHDIVTENFVGGPEFKGRRFNDFHYTRAFKQAARDRKATGGAGSRAAE